MNVASSPLPPHPSIARISSGRRRPKRRLAIVRISISIVVALAAAQASGEIYKCTARKSIPKYQNFPCEFDTLGAVPASSAPELDSRTTAATAVERTATPIRPARSVVHRGTGASVPRVGMTTDEVRALWGEPVETNKEEFVKGTFETWTYADSRAVQFDRKGRVTSIKR
ncbi:MAG TPA: hypothetical protein VLN42_11700 [Casimicrobiaceae bacterium]|nr:hypothetical protein [Casimicrobiaceae bacterium]